MIRLAFILTILMLACATCAHAEPGTCELLKGDTKVLQRIHVVDMVVEHQAPGVAYALIQKAPGEHLWLRKLGLVLDAKQSNDQAERYFTESPSGKYTMTATIILKPKPGAKAQHVWVSWEIADGKRWRCYR